MSEEYDLKKSKKTIGQLYPILEAKDGEIIDGFHREEADKNWKRVRLDHIDTEEKKLIARLVANFHRRQLLREEKAEWINGLARIYQKQGLKIRGERGQNEIVRKLCEATGLNFRTVIQYMDEKYKQEYPSNIDLEKRKEPRVSASQVIETKLGSEMVERIRKEVLEEVTLSPKQKAKREAEKQRKKEEQKLKREENKRKKEEKLQKQAEERAKNLKVKELIKDKDFQREVLKEISKPQIVKGEERGETEPEQIVKEMVEEYTPAIKEAYENSKIETSPEPERNKLVLNMLLKNLQQGLVFCPICGKRMFECSSCHTPLEKMKENAKI